MKKLILLLSTFCLLSCGPGKGGNNSEVGAPTTTTADDPRPSNETCKVNIDESTLKAAAISWMRVARQCRDKGSS